MIRIGVVGAGIMGTNHVRLLGPMSRSNIIAVCDPDADKGTSLARAAGCAYVPDSANLAGQVDAAVLAVPSELHALVGVPLLEAGIDLLVEKPIATDVADAVALVDAAKASGAILMVGHIERFNPAVMELAKLITEPRHLELTRVGPFTTRASTDVVLDLMIHDLDLARALAGAEAETVQAMGRSVRSNDLDIATALIRFTNGVTATVVASRAGQSKVRRIDVTQDSDLIQADLLRQDITVHRVDHLEYVSEGGARYRQTGLIEIPFIEQRGEPLAIELSHFLDCVESREQPVIGGDDALRALELAIEIRRVAGVKA
jgi:predicted dehydrogenase